MAKKYLVKVGRMAQNQADGGPRYRKDPNDRLERRVYHDTVNAVYTKRFNFYNPWVYERITTLTPRAYPGNLLAHGYDAGGEGRASNMHFTWREIQGQVLSQEQWDDADTRARARQWLVEDLRRTFPVVHDDPSRTNLLWMAGEPHALVDFDDIQITDQTLDEAIATLNDRLDGTAVKTPEIKG